MFDIIHRVGIKAPIAKVFEAISTIEGLAGWWTESTEGSSEVGGTIEFTFKTQSGETIGKMDMKVTELSSHDKVVWKCTDGPEEWIGTDITFELSEADDQTILIFGHRNWKEWVEFTAHCSTKWAVFLLSLKELIETGTGKPSPNDIKIDNWN